MSEKQARTDQVGEPTEVTAELRAVADVVGAPEFVLPWLDRFYDAGDRELLLAAAGEGAHAHGGAGGGGHSPDDDASGQAAEADGGAEVAAGGDRAGDGAAALASVDAARLERAVRRAVLDAGEAGAYAPADFHERLEIWAMFEGWKDLPPAVHRQLADWDIDYYAARVRSDVQSVRDGHPTESYEAHYTYVLLDEAEAIVNAQEHIFLWPCDCRSIVGNCRKPVDVCLRFGNDRGLGWEISQERAVEILRSTDKAGLMHTADLHDDPVLTRSICNCCTDCCYPHLAADRLESAEAWPIRRYVARIDMGLCETCGRCARRCPFDAIVALIGGRPEFDAARCRGCGLCATGCSAGAIELLPLAGD